MELKFRYESWIDIIRCGKRNNSQTVLNDSVESWWVILFQHNFPLQPKTFQFWLTLKFFRNFFFWYKNLWQQKLLCKNVTVINDVILIFWQWSHLCSNILINFSALGRKVFCSKTHIPESCESQKAWTICAPLWQ